MKKNLILILIILYPASLFSQAHIKASEIKLMKTIEVLCSDSLAGRGFGSSGIKKAESYIIGKFEEYGLQRLSDSFCQQVPLFSDNPFFSESFFVVGHDTLIFGLDYGYGLFEREGHIADTGGELLQLTTVFEPERGALPNQDLGAVFYKNKDARDICIEIGVEVCISIMSNDSVLPVMYSNSSSQNTSWRFDPVARGGGISFIQLSNSAGAKLLGVSPEQLERGLKQRDVRRLSKSPPVFELMINRVADATESCNIIGFFPGQDNAVGYIVLSAHYDHLGFTNMGFFPGANDNASGVAVLLEVARMLNEASKHGIQPKQNIVLTAFTAEEIGIKGSRYFMDHPLIHPDSILLQINMDMVGHLNPKELKVRELFLLAPDTIAQFVKPFLHTNEKLGNLQLSLSSELPERINFLLNSADNKPFLELGVSSLLITDGPFVEFHSFKDTSEVLDLGKMSALSELIYEVLMNHSFHMK